MKEEMKFPLMLLGFSVAMDTALALWLECIFKSKPAGKATYLHNAENSSRQTKGKLIA